MLLAQTDLDIRLEDDTEEEEGGVVGPVEDMDDDMDEEDDEVDVDEDETVEDDPLGD